jgi:NADH:ubiquinone oxidoreductase subunit B-like Fe-S oxidoreductase
MNQPEHIAQGLNALLRKIEAKRNKWKSEQAEEAWIIEQGNNMNDWFLEAFGDERARHNQRHR